jgi:hypothetical protein
MYQGIDTVSQFACSAVCLSGDGLCAAAGLPRPWRDLERLDLLFPQVVATAITFAPERRPDVRSLRHHPGPLVQHAGQSSFYDQTSVQFVHKLSGGGHTFWVNSDCGENRVKFGIGK